MVEKLLKNLQKISRECWLVLICCSLPQVWVEERVQEQLQLLLKLRREMGILDGVVLLRSHSHLSETADSMNAVWKV
jgi:hypothetical protein